MIKVFDNDVLMEGRLIRTARLDGDKYLVPENPEAILEGLRKCGKRIDIFTFLQGLPETSPKYHYPMEWDNLAVLPISTFENWWMNQLGFKARNKVKQSAKKGLLVREAPFDDSLVRGIWEIYNESPVRQGRPFWHYGKDVETVRAVSATFLENSVFIGAFLEDRLIGFAKLTWDQTKTQAGLMHIISMIQHRDKAPTNALIAQAVKACADRKIPYLVYSNFAYGKKRRDTLSDFKERMGFARVDIPRYYIPLTLLGQLAFRMGLHHKLVDYLPESIAEKIREARKNWHARRFQSVTEAKEEA